MATLKTQYENYKKENPNSELTYDEWFEQLIPYVSDDLSIWDNTLLDGLEEYISDLDKILITIYMLGFNDKLDNKPFIDIPLILRAYNLGRNHTIIGDDTPVIDYQTKDEILQRIYDKNHK